MPDSSHNTILASDEAARRVQLLSELQAALKDLGMHSVLARNHRLVLRWHNAGPFEPSGQTSPQLHIFTPAGTTIATIATTDGTSYHLSAGPDCPAVGSTAAAALIRDHIHAAALR